MPQGGVDSGENYYQAALRELEEETSIKNIEFVKEIEGYILRITRLPTRNNLERKI